MGEKYSNNIAVNALYEVISYANLAAYVTKSYNEFVQIFRMYHTEELFNVYINARVYRPPLKDYLRILVL